MARVNACVVGRVFTFLAVAVTGEDTVQIYDASSLSSQAAFSVTDRPYGLAYAPDGHHLLVTHLLSGSTTVAKQ